MASFSLCLCVAFSKLVVALQQRKFGFTARRSAGLHARRRAREFSRTARIPCHLDHEKALETLDFQGFFVCPVTQFLEGVLRSLLQSFNIGL